MTNGNWVDNVTIWYSSVMHQNQQYHSASLQWHHIWNHMRQDSGIYHLYFTTSHIPLQSFSDFREVSRSPIIRSIRLLAAHATVGRHLTAEHTVQSFTSTAHTPADLQWTQLCHFRNRKPVLAFPKTEKPVLQREAGFRVLETLVLNFVVIFSLLFSMLYSGSYWCALRCIVSIIDGWWSWRSDPP